MKHTLAIVMFFFWVLHCCGQQSVQPKDRAAVLDVLRASIRDSIHQDVKFRVLFINRKDNWLLLHAHPLPQNGAEHVYSQTKKITGDINNVYALFQLQDGKWQQRECAITTCDVPDNEMLHRHGLQNSGLGHMPPPYLTTVAKEERAAILDALRAHVDQDIHIAVKFEVQTMHRSNDWVLMSAIPRHMDGKAIDYAKTHYREQVEFAFDDQVVALLHKQDGAWKVLQYTLGATDYSGDYWLQLYGLKGCAGMQ